MDPKVVEVEGFQIVGITVRTTNEAEADVDQAKIPSLWGRYFADGIGAQNNRVSAEAYGVYWDYESDASGAYNVTAGARVPETYHAEEGQSVLRVRPGMYLAFHAAGTPQEVVPVLWRQVWEYFSRPGRHKRSYTTDFERYEGPAAVTIFIAVEAIDD